MLSATPTPARAAGARGVPPLLLVIGIGLIAVNLRPALVAVGPLTDALRHTTGLSSSAAGLLTTLPLFCFGSCSLLAAPLARRVGIEPALLGALVVLVAGVGVRLLTPVAALYVGSAVAGVGIAIGNVLLPGLIKRDFAERTGAMMTLYSVCLNGGAALAAGVTIPLEHLLHIGWRETLALWGLFGLAAVLAWAPVALRNRTPFVAAGGPGAALLRSGLAWATACFMGLQSLEFYALTAWLPTLLHDHGMSSGESGLMLSIVAIAATVAALGVPGLATRMGDQRALVLAISGLFLLGFAGLAADPVGLAVLWMILLGAAAGAAVTLALTMFVLRTRSAQMAAQLSAMAQAAGYLLASAGPFVIGALHGLAGEWTVPLLLLIVLLAPMAGAGWIAGADRVIED